MYKMHRYIGFLISPLILIVSITGIFLNHTDRLALDKKALPESIVRMVYAGKLINDAQLMLNGITFNRDRAGQLYVNEKNVGRCEGSLLTVESLPDQIVAVCANRLLFFTTTGELLEELGASLGVPLPFDSAQVFGDSLLLVHDTAVWQLNPESLQVQRLSEDVLASLYQRKALNRDQLFASQAGQQADFTVERLLLDLHAGRILGNWGMWLLDLTAVALLLMVVSGFCGWRKRKLSEL